MKKYGITLSEMSLNIVIIQYSDLDDFPQMKRMKIGLSCLIFFVV